ncbi:hypothetical protein M2158_002339 [Streptomyces sp. SAI-144]|uniref:hypothetical protein n=1 Tax=Streptomyces sp. SAI-144 TaxID=2940544 RepID=UPI00247352D8|nr:hypothetical protein [Streptomyces sp. SAI-144]MDH6433862.1 hypothetical protein [Streptomyces sp. SAI-144]
MVLIRDGHVEPLALVVGVTRLRSPHRRITLVWDSGGYADPLVDWAHKRADHALRFVVQYNRSPAKPCPSGGQHQEQLAQAVHGHVPLAASRLLRAVPALPVGADGQGRPQGP